MPIPFRHLKVEQCPTCGCSTIVSESVETDAHYIRHREPSIRVHCNGQRWENRQFLCGCVVQWVPNFECPQVERLCPKHPDLITTTKSNEKLDKQEESLRAMRKDLLEVERLAKIATNRKLNPKHVRTTH